MDLDPVLAQFPSVRVAQPGDNARILEFYDRTALSGKKIQLRSVRSPDFFGLLKYQSDRYTVLIDEDGHGEIRGVATLTHRQAYLGGEAVEAAYLGDFRISFNRDAMKIWRKFYAELLKACPVPTITCVIDENRSAQNALIRAGRKGYEYELLSPYTMINVLGRAPWWAATREKSFLKIVPRRATERDLPAIEAFLDAQSREHAFGYCYGQGELKRRLSAWDGLKAESFFLLEREGDILGCFALWSPARAKVNVIERIPWYYKLYGAFVKLPKAGEALKTMYLTHLELDSRLPPTQKRRCFELLFDYMAGEAWDPSWHMVSFCDFPALNLSETLRVRYLVQKVPMKLFTVRSPDAKPLALDSSERSAPGFEIALV